jgi:hypothetical protein
MVLQQFIILSETFIMSCSTTEAGNQFTDVMRSKQKGDYDKNNKELYRVHQKE